MRRRAKFTIILAAIFAIAFIIAVPVVGASTPGIRTCSAYEIVCSYPQIHFTQSLDYYLLGAGSLQWVGVYYFQGSLGIGCAPS